MMRITLTNIAKHFNKEVVFTGVDHVLEAGSRTAVLGPNGSGKSTLLHVVAGALIPTAGTVAHTREGAPIDPEAVYRHVSIAAPYLNLYEELTLRETIANHLRFKPLRNGIGTDEAARIAYLEAHLGKPVRNFSSGMKQRLKLALAILSDTPLLLLDEPTSNLDAEAVAWYRALLSEHLAARTLVVASNRLEAEYDRCTEAIEIGRYK
ncbi:MAG: ABC transporter ATP-binding protein [Flavobacteriales bacterium]